MATYEERRHTALTRLHDLVASRRAWDDYTNKLAMEDYQRQKSEYEQGLAKQKTAEHQDKLNWLNEGSEGAKLGGAATGGSPIGYLVGGILGTAAGQKTAYDERRKGGQGKWKAFTRTIFDTPGGSNKLNRENMSNMAGAAGNAYAYKQRQDSRKETALQEGQAEADRRLPAGR